MRCSLVPLQSRSPSCPSLGGLRFRVEGFGRACALARALSAFTPLCPSLHAPLCCTLVQHTRCVSPLCCSLCCPLCCTLVLHPVAPLCCPSLHVPLRCPCAAAWRTFAPAQGVSAFGARPRVWAHFVVFGGGAASGLAEAEAACRAQDEPGICRKTIDNVSTMQSQFSRLWTQCQRCQVPPSLASPGPLAVQPLVARPRLGQATPPLNPQCHAAHHALPPSCRPPLPCLPQCQRRPRLSCLPRSPAALVSPPPSFASVARALARLQRTTHAQGRLHAPSACA